MRGARSAAGASWREGGWVAGGKGGVERGAQAARRSPTAAAGAADSSGVRVGDPQAQGSSAGRGRAGTGGAGETLLAPAPLRHTRARAPRETC